MLLEFRVTASAARNSVLVLAHENSLATPWALSFKPLCSFAFYLVILPYSCVLALLSHYPLASSASAGFSFAFVSGFAFSFGASFGFSGSFFSSLTSFFSSLASAFSCFGASAFGAVPSGFFAFAFSASLAFFLSSFDNNLRNTYFGRCFLAKP